MDQNKTIEFLPPQDFKVLKVIQIEGPEWNRFKGYLPYLRDFNKERYDNKLGDFLDEEILKAVQTYSPKSFLRYSIEIFFKGQLEDKLRMLEGGARKKVTIQFTPYIPSDELATLLGKTFYAYPWEFDLRLLFSENQKKLNNLDTFYLCSLPFDKIDEIVKTIKAV